MYCNITKWLLKDNLFLIKQLELLYIKHIRFICYIVSMQGMLVKLNVHSMFIINMASTWPSGIAEIIIIIY